MDRPIQDAAQGRAADATEGQAPTAFPKVSGKPLFAGFPGQRAAAGQCRLGRRRTAEGLGASRTMTGTRRLQFAVNPDSAPPR